MASTSCWSFNVRYPHCEVIEGPQQEQEESNEATSINNVYSLLLKSILVRPQRNSKRNGQKHESKDKRKDSSGSCKLGPHRRHSSAMWAAGQGIVQRVEQEVLLTMDA